jgi:hypothetical protein
MSYAFAVASGVLLACPFCRQMFTKGEASECPTCGLRLASFESLPLSHDALAEDEAAPPAPEDTRLPFTYWRRGRGALAALGLAGMALFFAPWLHETAPELRQLNGFGLAQKLGYLWGPFAAFLVLVPVALSRRTVRAMRGARVAVAFLSAIPVIGVAVRLAVVPKPRGLVPLRFEWGWGLYATAVVGLVGLALAYWFGGRTDDMPSAEKRPEGSTLH